MRIYKIIWLGTVISLALAAAYGAFMYVYTDHMFAPVTLLAQPNPAAPALAWNGPARVFVHKVNTPKRAQRKENKFDGFEVDVWTAGNEILAAHDEKQAAKKITLEAIFRAVKNPAAKMWWLDLKTNLTPQQLQDLVLTAQKYHIPKTNLLFEAAAGPTARLIKQNGLGLLLPIPDGFEQDNQNPARRNTLNKQALALWEEYQPVAAVASFGKYGHLKAYFPQMPKAIYYSSTRRPSLKKPLMKQHIQKDPSVKIFMLDEYTWFNL